MIFQKEQWNNNTEELTWTKTQDHGQLVIEDQKLKLQNVNGVFVNGLGQVSSNGVVTSANTIFEWGFLREASGTGQINYYCGIQKSPTLNYTTQRGFHVSGTSPMMVYVAELGNYNLGTALPLAFGKQYQFKMLFDYTDQKIKYYVDGNGYDNVLILSTNVLDWADVTVYPQILSNSDTTNRQEAQYDNYFCHDEGLEFDAGFFSPEDPPVNPQIVNLDGHKIIVKGNAPDGTDINFDCNSISGKVIILP